MADDGVVRTTIDYAGEVKRLRGPDDDRQRVEYEFSNGRQFKRGEDDVYGWDEDD